MKQNASVLIVDDDMIPITLWVIRCLGLGGGIDVHVLSFSKVKLPIFRFSKYVKSYTNKNIHNDNEGFDAIREVLKKTNAKVILPIRERTIKMIAERRDNFPRGVCLPLLPDPPILDLVGNKWLLYNWLYDNKLTSVMPLRYIDLIQKHGKLENMAYPVLIKPFTEAGGTGIVLLRNEEELLNYKPNKQYRVDELLIQPYIEGFDIDFSTLASQGSILAYTIQRGIGVKKKFVYSRYIEILHSPEFYNHASHILKILNYSGIAHIDFRYDISDGSFKLVDFNARFWRSIMGSLKAGINFPLLSFQKAISNDFHKTSFSNIKYTAESNPFRIFLNGATIRNSDFYFDMVDPMPFIAGIYYHFAYLVRNKLHSL